MARKIVTVSRDIREYTPKDWIDEKGKPELKAFTVKFKPLSKRQLATIADSSARFNIASNTIMLGNAENMYNVFRMAVTGWDNWIVNDSVVPYVKDGSGLLDADLLEDFPLDIIEEIGNHIVEVSKATEELIKK